MNVRYREPDLHEALFEAKRRVLTPLDPGRGYRVVEDGETLASGLSPKEAGKYAKQRRIMLAAEHLGADMDMVRMWLLDKEIGDVELNLKGTDFKCLAWTIWFASHEGFLYWRDKLFGSAEPH